MMFIVLPMSSQYAFGMIFNRALCLRRTFVQLSVYW